MDAYKKLQEKEATLRKQVAEQFQRNVAKHEITILHEDGVYRHIRFKREDSGGYHFSLITWPWHLAIVGDLGTGHIFMRLEDMFQFFRTVEGESINPQYWAQKLVSSDEVVKRYDQDLMELMVGGHLQDVEADHQGLTKAMERDFFHDWYGPDLASEDDVRQFLRDYKFAPSGEEGYYPFTDALMDWDFTTWDHSFLWACHAITWGIKQYDKHLETANGT